MTKEELYHKAKEAYYNGQEIMSDTEFDALEKELGLENKSYIGTKSSTTYTVRHPFIMGSLYKVQVHSLDDFSNYTEDIKKYVGDNAIEVTPKFDGCSFECVINANGTVGSISSRGDGNYGKDLRSHLIKQIRSVYPDYYVYGAQAVIRGEVLVKLKTFEEKYKDKFSSPRSMVSGVLNSTSHEYDDDLDIIIYDYRVLENGKWTEREWYGLPKTPKFYKLEYPLNNDTTI
jgi:NAD-dependent DNA ligase